MSRATWYRRRGEGEADLGLVVAFYGRVESRFATRAGSVDLYQQAASMVLGISNIILKRRFPPTS